jgi:hypothetical protein
MLSQSQSNKQARGHTTTKHDFFNIFYLYFAKINSPPQILQNYTSAAVAHGGRDIPPCGTTAGVVAHGPAVWDEHIAVTDGGRDNRRGLHR